jgi:poly-gamma-glutamate capsule biosynthesis protein CapA/YwtB (metallophosphatase superfamily)
MNRRQLLVGMGAAAAVAAVKTTPLTWVTGLQAQAAIDWPARIAALARPAANEIVVTAVGDMIISSPANGRSTPEAQQMYRVLHESDAAFGNCEEPVASVGFMYQKTSQMAWPEILDDFTASGFTMLSAANNHYMDLGDQGLLQGLDESRKRGLAISGAGRNIAEATSVAVRTVKGARVGLIAFWCSAGQNEYTTYARAGESKTGVAVIGGQPVTVPDGKGGSSVMTLPLAADMRTLEDAVKKARSQVDFLMVSFHQHWAGAPSPNPRRSDPANRRILPADLNDPVNQVAEGRRLISRAAIDAGADVILGHGPHVLNGVEIYKGKPIIHSLGHFYMEILRNGKALPEFRFNPGMVASVENNWYLEEHRWAAIARMFVRGNQVTRLEILPVFMDVQKDGFPFLPGDPDAKKINDAMIQLSKPMGTTLRTNGWYTEVTMGT